MPEEDAANLELTPGVMQSMGAEALARIVAHLAAIGTQPARGDVNAEALCRAMREGPPENGTGISALLDPLFDEWIPRSFTTPGPGYLAYIPVGGLFPAAVADFISAATNRYTGVWMAAPALVQLEANVLDWFRQWMGFPGTARGLLTTGGSMAGFNAILCAREQLLGPDIRSGVLYSSTQVHHSVVKAARLAGILPDRVRTLPVDAAFRMRVDALASGAGGSGQGLRPFRSPRQPAPPTPAPWIRSTRLPTSATPRACGTTWTAPTAPSSTCARSFALLSAAWREPTR
jgi:aromatic-L-amino-acid decarboxylase